MDASSSRAPLVVHKKVCKRGQLAIWRPTGEGEAGKRKRGIAFLGVDGEKGKEGRKEDYAERAIYIREKKERMAKMTLEERYFLGDSFLIPLTALGVLI